IIELTESAARSDGGALQRTRIDEAAVGGRGDANIAGYYQLLREYAGRIVQDPGCSLLPRPIGIIEPLAIAIVEIDARNQVQMIGQIAAPGERAAIGTVIAITGNSTLHLALDAGEVGVEDQVHHAGDG